MPAQGKERWRFPDKGLTVVFVVILDWNIRIAAQRARTGRGRCFSTSDSFLQFFELLVAFFGAVAVIPIVFRHWRAPWWLSEFEQWEVCVGAAQW